ncbi:anti-anti-sigma factor [Marinobacter pelagius]|uniref:Anti-sigma factor antagonist n=1 Tax=Marinobacter pelagius TaxID=379482 RepID=A0A366GDY2_9GAMM|nr:STAS domain-containing protein [Marinobacter pelagius]RBP25047.1 anti-anti-sigma factor [Marinobacter pelagius]
MSLSISCDKPGGGVLTVTLAGQLNSDTAQQLQEALNDHLDQSIRMVAIDLGEVGFISSAGLRVIFRLLKQTKARGGQVSVSRMSPGVRKVFEIVQVLPDLTVFADQEEMDEYLAEIQRRERG